MSTEDAIAKMTALLAALTAKPKKPEPTKEDHLRERARGVSTTSYEQALAEKKRLLKNTLNIVKQDLDLKEFSKQRYTPAVPGEDETWRQPPVRKCRDCGKPCGTH